MGKQGVHGGQLIVFEGIDGTGKTTQAKRLFEALCGVGIDAIMTHEPGGTDLGKDLKKLLHENDYDAYTQFFLHMAAANEHSKKILIPALEDGKIVLCDRHRPSREMYQCAGAGIPFDLLSACHEHVPGTLAPDLCFVFLLDPQTAYERSVKRDGNPCMDEKNREKMTRIADRYSAFAHSGQPGVVALDARLPEEVLFEKVFDQTLKTLLRQISVHVDHRDISKGKMRVH